MNGNHAARESQVVQWFGRLEGSIDKAETIFEALEKRLIPVSAAVEEASLGKPPGGPVPPAVLVPLAERLRTQAERVNVLAERIVLAMQRLEI